jgi:site-specific DNA-adenine methylase
LGFNIHLEFRQYKFSEVCRDTFEHFDVIDRFQAKMNNSKINKYKFNNNNKTNTKHEFNVKYERYKLDISKDRKLCLGKQL